MAQLNPQFASALVLLLSALHGLATAQGGCGQIVNEELPIPCCRAALIDKNRQRCVFSSFSFYSATEIALNRKKIGTLT
jgi:hypothetical protein